ncbi:MAG: aspartate kinase [Desulfobacterales bacterium]|nr:aspartate kinase [Desulfobacterales bacterium]
MLTVEKIGGTSMSQFHTVLHNIFLRPKENPYNRIFVVSAYSGVTNWLLEDKKTGAPGIYLKFSKQEQYEYALDELLDKLIAINQQFKDIGLDQEIARKYITQRIQDTKSLLHSMSEVLASGYVLKNNLLLASREILASIGEAHSAFNSVNIIQHHNIHATFVDLSGFHDSEFLTIDERIRKSFKSIDFLKTITVATGYTKGTEGIMREFDRGYSEVTFSKVAVAVKADEAIIHKEYHLSSADPVIVGTEEAVPVGNTNYDVADQLADIGMEAIHPKASKPLEKLGINLRIKNTFEPEHPGTLISKDFKGTERKVEMIAGSDKVVIIDIHDSLMVGEVGVDLNLMELFKKYNISYILKSTNANSISMVIWEKQKTDDLINELTSRYQLVTVKDCAIVCAMGSNISKPGVLAQAASILAKNHINIESVAQSLRQVNMQFVIDRPSFKKAVCELNKALCLEKE